MVTFIILKPHLLYHFLVVIEWNPSCLQLLPYHHCCQCNHHKVLPKEPLKNLLGISKGKIFRIFRQNMANRRP